MESRHLDGASCPLRLPEHQHRALGAHLQAAEAGDEAGGMRGVDEARHGHSVEPQPVDAVRAHVIEPQARAVRKVERQLLGKVRLGGLVRLPNQHLVHDRRHIGGRRDLIAPLCQQAMDMGFDGLIVESHCNPDEAWSDASQQVLPDVLDFIIDKLVIRDNAEMTESLASLRKQIDEMDNELMNLLTKRMRISREIASYKKEHNMAVVQAVRYNEILDKRGAQGALCGMASDFVRRVYEAIHEESVRQQMEIINK